MKVLIFQSETESAQNLKEIFVQRGDEVFNSLNAADAFSILQLEDPELIILDLHLPKSVLLELLRGLRNNFPDVNVIISNRYPDLLREIDVKDFGANVFLRAPFSITWVENALGKLKNLDPEKKHSNRKIMSGLPGIRISVRLKIILPYLFLSLGLAMAVSFVVSQATIDTIEDRFVNNLIEAGKLTNAWLVEEENNRLKSLRLLSFTVGLPESVLEKDTETLRDLVLGLAINNQEEAIEILDSQGVALISIRHIPDGGRESFDISKGDNIFVEAEFVQKVLNQSSDDKGDKFAGIVRASWGNYFYIAGPIIDEEKQLIGAVLVGRSIPTMVLEAREILLGGEDTFAHISLYGPSGETLGTTLLEVDTIDLPDETVLEIYERQDYQSQARSLSASGIDYREILSPWEIRGGQDIGLLGVSLAETFLVRTSQQTQLQIYILTTIGLLLTIGVGMYLSRMITQPLKEVVTAASKLSQGDWDVRVEPKGTDELAILAHTFNYMVSNLKEGEIYRDLLGRTISPQVRDQLREGFASGNLKLKGQSRIATVMMTDIRNFTSISESETPTTVLDWLNQYFEELVPIINTYGGITSEFMGDGIMAFFGILPVSLDPSESAQQACMAAAEILLVIKAMNVKRREAGIPPMVTGIGINTGVVAAGAIGTADRLHYSIIGDAVNVAQRVEVITKELNGTSIIISQHTYKALGDNHQNFIINSMGSHILKGKSEPINVYRLMPKIFGSQPLIKVDINNAQVGDFLILEGISSKIASNIIEYRNANGYFSHVEEIKEVSGIGINEFRRIEDHIKIDQQTKFKDPEKLIVRGKNKRSRMDNLFSDLDNFVTEDVVNQIDKPKKRSLDGSDADGP